MTSETVADVLAEMRNSGWPSNAENWAERIDRALRGAEVVAWYSPELDAVITATEMAFRQRDGSADGTTYTAPLYLSPPAPAASVPVESLGRDAGPASKLDVAMRARGLPTVSDALGYSRNFADANPHLTQTAKDHITGLCDMLELASAHSAPPLASVPEGWAMVPRVATSAMISSGWESGKLVGDTRIIISVSGVWDAMISTAAAHNNPASDYALCCDTPAYCSSVRRCTATDAVRDGPQTITKKVCDGCPHLKTEWWKDYLDNDETDSGTMAVCTLAGKNINAYWGKEDPPPIWCPIAPPTNQEGAAP